MNQNNFMQQPNPSVPQGQMIQVMLVPDINNIDGFSISPGTTMMFLNEQMTEFKLRSRNMNGFPNPERTWKLEETTPKPEQGGFVSREEFQEMSGKMDKILSALSEFMK